MDSRFYPGVEADFDLLMADLQLLFDSDYQVQTMKLGEVRVLQAKKSGTFLDLTGLSSALTIRLSPESGGTRIEAGMQKWIEKAAVAGITYFLFPPLIALPLVGAYSQYKLTERAWQIIEQHIAEKSPG